MTPSDFYLALVFGFVSSLHCVQMCGPIVLTYSVAANADAGRRSLLGFHLGDAVRTLNRLVAENSVGLQQNISAHSVPRWIRPLRRAPARPR